MSRPPWTLLGAAGLQSGLGVVVIGLGGYGFVYVLRGQAAEISAALPLAAVAVVVGGLLAYVAWSLLRLKDWARTPVVVTQIFALPIAYYLWQTEAPLPGGILAAVALLTLALVLAPPSTAALFGTAAAKKP